jgi:predicted acylesterase/phospholipase RssA
MKALKIFSGIILLAVFGLLLTGGRRKDVRKEMDFPLRSGTAIIMTGAAARIPQEGALLEELYNRGLLKDVVFISGVSSGALNSVILNGILSGKMTWEDYKNILFKLNNSDIFIQDGRKLPVNTDPARNFITGIVEGKLGYYTIGDLPFMTEISFTHLKLKKSVYRMCSRKINEESDTTLSLVDILMASTAFPVAFPPVRIRNVKTIPDVGYIDGGVGDDHIPYHALLDFEKFRGVGVEKVYIISRKCDSIPKVSDELEILGIDDKGIFDKLGISLDNILKKGIYKRLESFAVEAPELVARSYIWIPDFDADFLMFNFGKLKEQYELTAEWAKTHNPTPVAEYLLPHLLSEKRNLRIPKESLPAVK